MFRVALFSVLLISYTINHGNEKKTPPSPHHEQKHSSQYAAVVFHRAVFTSRDVQYSPLILNFQTATITVFRHDTYLK
jgi:hypothetical protein